MFGWYMTALGKPIFMSEISAIQSVDVLDPYADQFNLQGAKRFSYPLFQQCGNDDVLPPCSSMVLWCPEPVGTGPAKLKEAIEGSCYTGSKPDYYLTGKDGLPLPYLDEVVDW